MILVHSPHYLKTDVIHAMYCIAAREGLNHIHKYFAQKMLLNLDEWFLRCVSGQTRQTDKHTDTMTVILCPPNEGKIAVVPGLHINTA